MERYKKLWEHVPSRSGGGDPVLQPTPQPISQPTPDPFIPINIKLDDLPWDPLDRPIIYSYDPNIVDEIRRIFLLKGGCPFRGHDETISSLNRGLFLELYHLLANENEETRMGVARAPLNCTLTSLKIQKQICECFVKEVLDSILEDIGDDVHGVVQERFVGVKETSSTTLKSAIDDFFTKHNLSLKQLRGQGYDGASNMRGEFNGLKDLVLKDNNLAHYVHCFAYQLQLVVVMVVKNHDGVMKFFEKLMCVVNVVSSSCKSKDIVRDNYKKRIELELNEGVTKSGKGKN
ncbi:zinc finger MYM-type protein 1-like protein [Tanacetum coccineum]|uniref:Zinc finger MYM-type protein 1-like protein n=1 Tax=Tanacetum coccineum TaxID=301880 RepID=A0ABQ5FRL2_9ASTR